jgi:hypothetical protein
MIYRKNRKNKKNRKNRKKKKQRKKIKKKKPKMFDNIHKDYLLFNDTYNLF